MVINPFRNTIVTDPWHQGIVDVSAINADAHRLCCQALDRVRTEGRSTSVRLCGEAGSGKTHLLARLRSYLKDQAQLFVFVSVRLHTNPNRLWRHIRKSFVESLLRSIKANRSQLEFVFMRRLYLHSQKKHLTVNQLRRDIDELSVEAELSWNVSKVIENFVRHRHRKDAIDWLKGNSLPSGVLENIGLAPQQDQMADPEDQAREIIYELCRLAGPTIPVVVCFDQVEALQRYLQDREAVFVFDQALRSFHDKTHNVLLVSCIQPYFLEQLKQIAAEGDYAAQRHSETALDPLTFKQSMRLVKARIDRCEAESELKTSLYKEFESKLKQIVWMKTGRTARDVLARCASIFEAWVQSESLEAVHPEPKQSDTEFLEVEFTNRQELAIENTWLEQIEDVFHGALPVLIHILDENWSEQDRQPPPDVDIILKSPSSKVAISFCNQQNLRSLAGRFKRLGHQIHAGDFDRLFLIRHPALPISLKAQKTRKYLAKLKGINAIYFTPDFELIAALEALRRIWADAKAGDLSNSGANLNCDTVIDWIKNNRVIPVSEFLNQIIGHHTPPASEDFEILQDVHTMLDEERVMKLVDAAVQLTTQPDRLQAIARNYPGQIGFLQGPPAVIFQLIPQSVPS